MSAAPCTPCDTPLFSTHHLAPDVVVHLIWEGAYNADRSFMGLPTDFEQFQFGCCLVQLQGGINVLLDTGCGSIDLASACPYFSEPPPNPLLQTLKRQFGVSPEDIQIVIHSHLHGDHIGNNIKVSETDSSTEVPSFPNAKHYVHRDEWEYATKKFATVIGGVSCRGTCPWEGVVKRKFAPLLDADMLRLIYSDGRLDPEAPPQIEVFQSPGHTPGHLGIRIRSSVDKECTAVYIGDALHVPAQVPNPELSPWFDCCLWPNNMATRMWPLKLQLKLAANHLFGVQTGWTRSTGVQARRKLLGALADDGALLLSPHFPTPGMGRVTRKEEGSSFTYAPLTSTEAVTVEVQG
jgi:glyoxylase-like metal-dependent hydrolase (beta-lactamase superfamily II)